MTTKTEREPELLLGQSVQALLEQVQSSGDTARVEKIRQLEGKWRDDRLWIAFCGHFSAGKSTLINRLCGRELLPSSPIPTSANVVTIANGQAGARVWREGADRAENVPLEQLEAHCKDGASVRTVELTVPLPAFGDRVVLMDTPGVDSTDDAHRLATESTLHLADVVFYVMDYNHVLSESNLAFTKQMSDWGKPVYLLVNMIDKHRENEVSFEAYRRGVEETFHGWHIAYADLLFLSLRETQHERHEGDKLLWTLQGLLERSGELRGQAAARSLRQLAVEHTRWLDELSETRRAELTEAAFRAEAGEAGVEALVQGEAALPSYSEAAEAVDAGERPAPELLARAEAQLDAKLAEWRGEGAAAGGRGAALLAGVKQELVKLLDNANVMPAGTRELAQVYLESRQAGFKVGWFAGAAKTERERERRLEALHADFAEQVKAQLVWHVRELLRGAFRDAGVAEAALGEQLAALDWLPEPDWLAQQVNAGAGASGEATLNYTRQAAAEVKAAYRRRALDAAEALAQLAGAAGADDERELAAQAEALAPRLAALRELARLEAAGAERAAAVTALAPAPAAAPALPDPDGYVRPDRARAAAALAAAWAQAAPQAGGSVPAAQPAAAAAPAAEAAAQAAPGAAALRERLAQAAGRLAAAADAADGVPALAADARALREQAERLSASRFTISLFGAFSAGKSSFANALVGEQVLPVSPNPTTAAINRILPPAPEWPHGTARVKMKSEQAIRADIAYSLTALGLEPKAGDAALEQIRKLKPADVPPKGKPHYAFLQSVLAGWSEAMPHAGEELRATEQQFREYVAVESRSCFVEWIELYYDSELASQGIVLVDTPGADSINARHTGVAFNYIRNADAILFVTYYNHAFSQADREFLMQLGRVKDSFALDKMFFIVNAADLAASPEELEGVVRHVEANLLPFGIRKPRIYPVSSLQAVEGKQAGDAARLAGSGLPAFEADFVRFAVTELADLAVRSADEELQRVRTTVAGWMAEAQADAGERQRKLERLERQSGEAIASLDASVGPQADLDRLRQEIGELLYHVKQRTAFRYGEWFSLAFNAATIREDAGGVRRSMRAAGAELQRLVSYQLSQEVLATTLRLERTLGALGEERFRRWTAELQMSLDGWQPPAMPEAAFRTPQIEEQLADIAALGDERWLAGHFKSSKAFFEGRGRDELKAAIEPKLQEAIAAYVERQSAQLADAYSGQYAAWIAEQADKLRAAIAMHHNGRRSALTDAAGLRSIEEANRKLASITSR